MKRIFIYWIILTAFAFGQTLKFRTDSLKVNNGVIIKTTDRTSFFDNLTTDNRLKNSAIGKNAISEEKAAADLISLINAAGAASYVKKDSLETEPGLTGENLLVNTSYRGMGTKFTPATTYNLSQVAFYCWRVGSPNVNLVCEIYTSVGSLPSLPGTLLATSYDTLNTLTIATAAGSNPQGQFYNFRFSDQVNTATYTDLFIVIRSATGSAGDGSNYIEWGRNAATESGGDIVRFDGSSFVSLQADQTANFRAFATVYDTTAKGVTVTGAQITDSSVTSADADAAFHNLIQGMGRQITTLKNEFDGTTGGQGENLLLNSSYLELANRFKAVTNDYKIIRADANIYRVGSPPGAITAKIYSNSSGFPDQLLGTSTNTITANTITTTVDGTWYTWSFAPIDASGHDSLWLVLDGSSAGNASNYVEWGFYSNTGGRIVRTASGWALRSNNNSLLSRIYSYDPDTSYVTRSIEDSSKILRQEYRRNNTAANIQNFLTKAASFYQTNYPDTLTVAFIGNSLTQSSGPGTGFVTEDSTVLESLFPNVPFDIQRWGYAGYNTTALTRMWESVVTDPNIDLLFFTDLEGAYNDQLKFTLIEHMIRMIRQRSNTDVVLQIPAPTSTNYPTGQQARWMRDISRRYNTGLVDANQVFLDTLALPGVVHSDISTDGVHPNARGVNIYRVAFEQLFDTTRYRYLGSNPHAYAEYTLEFEDAITWYDSTLIRLSDWADWEYRIEGDSVSNGVLASKSAAGVGDTITVNFDGYGFDLYYVLTSGGGTMDVLIDGQKPSAIRVNNRPLEYATLIVWEENNSQGSDVNYRGFKAFVMDTTRTGTWTISVIDAALDSFMLEDPNSVDVGHGHFNANFTSNDGDIFIPVNYGRNGQSQWLNYASYALNDQFYFTVKRKWVDSIDFDGTTDQRKRIKIWGLKNERHTLQLIKTGNDRVKLDKMVVHRSMFGRP